MWSNPIRLGPPHLELLSAIDRDPPMELDALVADVAARTDTTEQVLKDFIGQLRYSGRLAQAPAPAARPVEDHPDHGRAEPLDLGASTRVNVRVPLAFRLHRGSYELIDHEGRRVLVLSAAELQAFDELIHPASPREALDRMATVAPSVSRERHAEVLAQLAAVGLLRTSEPAPEHASGTTGDREVFLAEVFDRHAAAQDAAERDRAERSGRSRPKVIPVAFDAGAPAGLGMVVAFARAYEGGRLDEFYDFRTDWVWSDDRFDQFTAQPAIYLFSNYLWSHRRCIEISKRVKERSPGSITIHGGPDTPKYEQDGRNYLAEHPHVDVIVRGEGEASAAATLAALTQVIGEPHPDLSVLEDVAGITYRDGDRVVRNPDRDRIAEVDTLPSPLLTGLFDVYAHLPELMVTIETNRGCPYGCTFCDWGSATNSRIRQFDLDRVYAELDWCSRMEVTSVGVADANFGIFKRDVDIAQRVADLKLASGHPRAFGVSYAKNTVKHLQHIINVLVGAGIMAQGVLSLQSMDLETLDTIHRSNIKTEKYDALADEMRRSRLPLMVELMMGLPGQTVESFADDIQQCIDREVLTRVNPTTLLVNSPMNAPDYVAEHEIVTIEPVGTGRNALVISTSSFTPQDYDEMEHIRRASLLYENFGVLRLVSRFVRQETGMREVDLYRDIRAKALADPGRWPALYATVEFGTAMMTSTSWWLLMADLRDYLVSSVGLPDDAALAAVLDAQRALLPAYGRRFPERRELPHDVVAWYHAVQAAKASDHRTDWPDVVPRLATFGAGALDVDDPHDIVETSVGFNVQLSAIGMNWELESPLSRARVAAIQLGEWVSDSYFTANK
jgi:hypothetical protein